MRLCTYRVDGGTRLGEVVGDEVRPDYIIPSVFDTRVGPLVAEYVAEAAVADGVCRTATA